MCNIFIRILDLGVLGAAISLNLTWFSNMIILDYWMSVSGDFEESLVKIDNRAFKGWCSYLSIGFFSAILECLGAWNLNICFLFSGYLGVTSIDTQIVVV